MTDMINHPPHYTAGSIEVIDFIEAHKLDFRAGNVVKYVVRAPLKNGLEDLKKARWYLDRLIQEHEGAPPKVERPEEPIRRALTTQPQTIAQIAAVIPVYNEQQVANQLSALTISGFAERVSRGTYRLARREPDPEGE